jgi:hypothetical protein
MAFNVGEIVTAWITAAKPNPNQKKLAEARYKICLGCEFYGEKRPITGDAYCKDCHCPISKKIFSQEYDACPKHFWLKAEEQLMRGHTGGDKKSKTII